MTVSGLKQDPNTHKKFKRTVTDPNTKRFKRTVTDPNTKRYKITLIVLLARSFEPSCVWILF